MSCEARKLVLCPSTSAPTFFILPKGSSSSNINTPQHFDKTAFGYEIWTVLFKQKNPQKTHVAAQVQPQEMGRDLISWKTTVWPNVLTKKWRQSQDRFVGFENELTLCVGWETLVQQQHPWTVCGTGCIPAHPSSQSGGTAPTISNVAHLNAEGELVAWVRAKSRFRHLKRITGKDASSGWKSDRN